MNHAFEKIAHSAVLFVSLLFSCGDISGSPLSKEQILQALVTGGLLGMHDTLGGEQADGFEDLAKACVKPAIWSGDLGFSVPSSDAVDRLDQREEQLRKMIRLGSEGHILTLSWHQCSPVLGEPCTFLNGIHGRLTPDQWISLLTEGGELNAKWLSNVEVLIKQLKELKRHNISVLLRPLHEMNVPGMWWHGDYSQSKRLWQMLHEKLMSLDNVIWVWSVTYHPRWGENLLQYYPGDDLVDVIGVDIYPAKGEVAPPFSEARDTVARLFENKPIGLSEVSKLPSIDEFQRQRWSYVVPWGRNMLRRTNSQDDIAAFYKCNFGQN